jgi:hypothetical protein
VGEARQIPKFGDSGSFSFGNHRGSLLMRVNFNPALLMKKPAFLLIGAACGLLLFVNLPGQASDSPKPATPPPQMAPADVAWLDVRAAMFVRTDLPKEMPADQGARRALVSARATRSTQAADRAKDFYTKYPDHPKADEAKSMEVQALLSASQSGDATTEGRLNFAVQALRADPKVSTKIKAKTVAMHAFNVAMRGRKTRLERMEAIEQVARNLSADFPTEPQGYESLLTVALSTTDDTQARRVADELLRSPANANIKDGAKVLLRRINLVGQSLENELVGADAKAAKASLKAGQSTVIYTWASWSPGSLALAAKLKERGVKANLLALNLDEDTQAAEALATKEALPGTAIYDERGRAGSLAQRLGIRSAPQVIIVDATGKISDVRGEFDLEKKLTQLGL